MIRLTTGVRIYLQAVIDNFSRRILAWRVSEKLSSATTRDLLVEASEDLPDAAANASVLFVTDSGPENFGEVDQFLEDSSSLSRVLAQIDIVSSNSLIDAFWRQLKHAWLFLNNPRQYGGGAAFRCLGAQLAISVHNCPVFADSRFPMSIFKRTQRKYVKKDRVQDSQHHDGARDA